MDIKGVWSIKCMILLVISGATGIVTKGLKISVEAIPGKHSVYSSQKAVVLGTSHIIPKVLQSETRNLSGGDRRWFRRKSAKEKRCVTKR
jgi:hypothetical protein